MTLHHDCALVATGCYRYSLNNQRQHLTEPWALYRKDEGWLLRSERQVPEAGLYIATETVWRDAELVCADLHWQQRAPATWQRSVRYQRHLKGGYELTEWSDMPADWPEFPSVEASPRPSSTTVLFPLMRIYMGHVIGQLLQGGGEGTVVVPWIKDPFDRHQLLKPSESLRSVHWLKDEEMCLAPGDVGHQSVVAQAYCYQGEQYGEDSTFWLHRGLLLQYDWQQPGVGQWRVSLSDFQCLPGAWPGLFQSWSKTATETS